MPLGHNDDVCKGAITGLMKNCVNTSKCSLSSELMTLHVAVEIVAAWPSRSHSHTGCLVLLKREHLPEDLHINQAVVTTNILLHLEAGRGQHYRQASERLFSPVRISCGWNGSWRGSKYQHRYEIALSLYCTQCPALQLYIGCSLQCFRKVG